MAITKQESAETSKSSQGRKYFSKAEKFETEITRFSYIPIGRRGISWDFKVDFDKLSLNDTVFVIDQQKFVGRPDLIAHHHYGNSKYWWIIAMRNGIKNPMNSFNFGQVLQIPNLQTVERLILTTEGAK